MKGSKEYISTKQSQAVQNLRDKMGEKLKKLGFYMPEGITVKRFDISKEHEGIKFE
jgi:hypothetical protein